MKAKDFLELVEQTKKQIQWDAIVEGILEFFRIGVLATLPVVIVMLENNTFDMKLVWATFAIALLKAIDKGLHKYGTYTGDELLEKGITRF